MLKRFSRALERVPAPLVILFVCIIAYGPLIPFLGFYWDDLPNMWVYHMFGAGGYITYASNHRPFSAWVFILTTPILGESPLGYHILSLLLRWAGSVAVWWTLKQLWPSAERKLLWVALLFAIYPGFRELPIATVFNVHLICLLLTFFSLGGMLWAIRNPRRYWLATLLSVAAGAISIFTMEYFIALELLRPVFIWMVLGIEKKRFWSGLRRIILHWLPYLAVLTLYGIWRVFIFKFPYYVPVLIDTSQSLSDRIANLLPLIAESIYKAGLLAWVYPLFSMDFTLMGGILKLLFGLILVGAIFVTLVFLWPQDDIARNGKPNPTPRSHSWSLQAIGLGILALLLAGWPIWIAGLKVDLEPLGSRFTLPFIFGSVLLLVGLIDLIPGKTPVKIGVVSILVGISCAWHLQTTNMFRYEWEVFKDLYWQLTWRAPDIKPDTALLSNDIPLRYYSDNSLTAMLNWTYAPDNESLEMPFLLDYISVRLGSGLPALEEGQPITQDYSILSFTGSTDETIAIFAMPPSCLRLLDRKLDDNYQRLPKALSLATNISNLKQIQFDQQATPPSDLFGAEPRPNWCYYFEKADLARQQEDWASIVTYGNQAFNLNDNPNEATERLPFIEGYAHMGQWDRALELSRDTYAHGKEGVLTMLCNTWARITKSTTPDPAREHSLQTIQSEFNCRIQ
jgi:NADH:ubiquinone oxidoreductase subunit 6 (subunit J)